MSEWLPLLPGQRTLAVRRRDDCTFSDCLTRVLRLSGELDVDRLVQAIEQLYDLEECLRLDFDFTRLTQRVLPEGKRYIKTYRLLSRSLQQSVAYVNHQLHADFVNWSFDVDGVAKFRIYLLDESEAVLTISVQHLAVDGPGMGLLEERLTALYNQQRIDPVPSFSATASRIYARHRSSRSREHWLSVLDRARGMSSASVSNAEVLRPARLSPMNQVLDDPLVREIEKFAAASGASLPDFITWKLLAALLDRSEADQVLIEVAADMRSRSDLRVAGDFTFMFPLFGVRRQLTAESVRTELLKGRLSPEIDPDTYDELIRLGSEGHAPRGRPPLLNFLARGRSETQSFAPGVLQRRELYSPKRLDERELRLVAVRSDSQLALHLGYNSQRFPHDVAKAMLDRICEAQ